jgi:hypothetical protein
MKPIKVLKKGLVKLQGQIREWKATLEAELKAGQLISEADQDWLDGEGNLIDEERVVEILDNASDYNQSLDRLDSQAKKIVEKLQKLAGNDGKDVSSKKQKHKAFEIFMIQVYIILNLLSAGPAANVTPAFTGGQKAKPSGIVGSQKKENVTLQQRIEILDWHHSNGAVQRWTAVHFNLIYPNLWIKQPLISSWVKDEAKWWAEYELSTNSAHSAKRICQTQHPEVTEMLDLWVSKAMADKLLLMGKVLFQKWKLFADLVGVPDDEWLNLSKGWLSNFKAWNGLKEVKWHGEAASAPLKTVVMEQLCIQELIKERSYKPCNIFNADESALFYAWVLSSILSADWTGAKTLQYATRSGTCWQAKCWH